VSSEIGRPVTGAADRGGDAVVHIEDVLLFALTLDGLPYIFGHEIAPGESNPTAADCAELVEWACRCSQVAPTVPDGSWIQCRHCNNHEMIIPVEQAIDTRGALLFNFSDDPFTGGRPSSAHVAMSLGDGTTIEARGRAWGVGTFPSRGRSWSHGGLLPGVSYAPGHDPLPPEADMLPDERHMLETLNNDLPAVARDAALAKAEAAAARAEAAAAKAEAAAASQATAATLQQLSTFAAEELARDRAERASLADLLLATGQVDRSKLRAETKTYLDNLANRPDNP
jgi:hypothetical protein